MVDGAEILAEMAQNSCSHNDSTSLSFLVHQLNKILDRKHKLKCLDFFHRWKTQYQNFLHMQFRGFYTMQVGN